MVPLLGIRVHDKRFGDRRLLDDVALDVGPGEFVALVGPSGCGKSTLLRIVAGLDRDCRATVKLQGRVQDGPSRDIGFVFQEPRLFPWLTVGENVAFDAGLMRVAAWRSPRVLELLEQVGLDGLAERYPKALSGGQAQRVALARGLFGHPRVLLLDEPFSAVDAFTRRRLQDLLLAVASAHRATVVLVTHDIEEAVYLSQRIEVLDPARRGIVAEVDVGLPRAGRRGDPRLADLERTVLGLMDVGHETRVT